MTIEEKVKIGLYEKKIQNGAVVENIRTIDIRYFNKLTLNFFKKLKRKLKMKQQNTALYQSFS